MTKILTKRVYQDFDASDGFRVLVDRLWPRGMRKESLHYDLWAKNIAPSTELRKWYHDDLEAHWSEFEFRYRDELHQSQYAQELIEQLRQYETVTLLFAAHNLEQNHALVLQDYLVQSLASV